MTENIPIRNPRSGEIDGHITPPTSDELDALTARLRKGQSAWLAYGVAGRVEVMQRWKTALANHKEALVSALTTDTGRARESGIEVDAIMGMIDRWCHHAPSLLAEGEGERASIPFLHVKPQYVPYALVGVISPWNFPLLLSLIDAIPALMAGCAVLIKPSEVTPRFVDPLREAIDSVPELAAVLAYVTGAGETGSALIDRVDLVCFTGSVATGRKVGEACARNFIPAFLELGGKDPALVLDSADVDYASSAILWGATSNAGQACQSIERVYVAENIYDAFVEKLTSKANKLKLIPEGGPIGPIIAERQIRILEDHLADALSKGAQAVTGGAVEIVDGGAYCRPTVLVNVDHTMKVMTEETFGAIIPVMKFSTPEEGIHLANDTTFGLSAAVFAGTNDEAEAVGRRLDAGGVSINDASLTAMNSDGEKQSFKLSGLGGSRMGIASIQRFFRKKALIIKNGNMNDPWWFSELND
ncbi:MAG: aldehyde dehydrogenase family protein [Aggregatilineales bacterium]